MKGFTMFVLAGAWTATVSSLAAQEPIRVPSVLLRVSEEIDLAARETGLLASVAVRPGAKVAEGDVLAQVEDSEARLAHAQAEAELAIATQEAENDVLTQVAEKTLAVAQTELRRNTELKAKFPDAVSQSEVDRLRLVAERSALEVQQAQHRRQIAKLNVRLKQHALEAAELALRRRKIVAPVGGVVVEVKKHAGEWVEPGVPVLRLVRIDRLRVEGYVEAALAPVDLHGAPVTLTIELPERKAQFPGEIVFVDPVVDPVNAQIRVWAEIDNSAGRLRPGLKGAMIIQPPGR
ncbi:MAG: efflux RND transporter periplasmic adaptor subunit [Planctomycetes bacterium]|nr:efflux RND transporter periplasmic adaptor subunit [Planctomycetota bacterium]